MITVAMLGQKGGSGKSSAARLLAVELARRGRKVVIVDLDVRQRTVSEWSQARALNDLSPPMEVVLVDHEAEPDFRLSELAHDGADVVVADAPGWIDAALVTLAHRAHMSIIPTSCSEDELRPAIRLYHDLVADGVDPARLCFLLNRVGTGAESKRARSKIAEGEVPESAVCRGELPELPIYRAGHDGGQAASEVSSKSPRDTAAALAAELIERMDKLQPSAAPKRFTATTW